MPKDMKANTFSYRGRSSPYACSSKNSNPKSRRPSPPVGNEREWEEARCPICMEHPHNAVLLLCASREKGCRPYMCDTSYRHSNCLDQFRKSSAVGAQQGDNVSGAAFHSRSQGRAVSGGPTRSHGQQQPELVCPLCRGHVKGWIVVEAARKFMDSKTRNCSLETCNFTGSYAELRRHARLEHPSERPSEADPTRQSEWTMMEHQRDFEDTFGAYQAPADDGFSGEEFEADLDFLTELSHDGALFDEQLDEAEEELDEINSMMLGLDFELEFLFSFLSEFLLVHQVWDGSPAGRHTSRSHTSERSQNRRSRRVTSRSNDNERRPASSRRTNLSSRHAPSSYRRSRWDR